MMHFSTEAHVQSSVAIKRERMLPQPGEILVEAGRTVAAMDQVGRTAGPGGWHYIHLSSILKVSPAELGATLLKQPGDDVDEGEVLATRKGALGIFRRSCRAPAAGRIVSIAQGYLLLKEAGESIAVRALLPGRVAGVLPQRGVVIETRGALIKAAWGTGESSFGVLKVEYDTPHSDLSPEHIDVGFHGAVVVAGRCSDADALRQLQVVQARGVILGSLAIDLRAQAEQLGMPVMLTEGFGSIPMSEAAFQLLRAYNGSEVTLMSRREDGSAGPPEIIIPLVSGEAPAGRMAPAELTAGQLVHIVGYPRPGAMGRIHGLPRSPRRIESGALVEGVEVRLPDAELLFVPRVNVEPVDTSM